MKKAFTKSFVFFFFLLLWVPLLLWNFYSLPEKPLYGAYEPRSKPLFSDSSWFSGNYQTAFEGYLNDSICLRNFFVRFRNQLDYSLFNKTHAIDNFVGKDRFLVAESHFDNYYGKSAHWPISPDSLVYKIKKIQDTLSRCGKTLLVVLAPNKGYTYPELAPFWYKPPRSFGLNDYSKFISSAKQLNINVLDFQNYFNRLKSEGKKYLYPFWGVHWTQYYADKCYDSLLGHLQFLRREQLPEFIKTGEERVDTPRYTDNDMEKLLNLLVKPARYTYTYQKFRIDTLGRKKINIAFVSDSYAFSWFFENQVQQSFTKWSNWYYYKRIDSNHSSHGKLFSQVSLLEQVQLHDVFVVMATGPNLSELGWGFFQNLYDLYFHPNAKRIHEWMEKIRRDQTFFDQIVRKANEAHIDVELQLLYDARYQVDEEDKRNNVIK